MRFFPYFLKRPLPSRASLRELLATPLTWYGALLWVLCVATLVVVYLFILTVNDRFLVTVPARGGTIVEGIIGAPHLINPTLATTDTDRSLVRLLYSGLTKENADGSIAPDLAESFSVSPDGLTYTFTLRDKLKWSDGKPLTAADVAFTMMQEIPSVGVTTPDDRTIIFTLTSPDAAFPLRLTAGILPKHIWEGIEVDTPAYNRANLYVVGSGPFKVSSMRSEGGVPVAMTLTHNHHYNGDTPRVRDYRILFFSNQSELIDALNSGTIDLTMSATSDTALGISSKDFTTTALPSTKSLAIIALANNSEAISLGNTIDGSIDKASILAIIENGYGILPTATESRTLTHSGSIALNVENSPRTLSAAYALKDQLDGLGFTTSIKAFDPGTFQGGIDAKLFNLALIESSNTPSGYERTSTLYTIGYPFLQKSNRYPVLPELLREPADRYRDITLWHARTNDVWKIFAR